VGLGHIHPNRIYSYNLSFLITLCFCLFSIKNGDESQAMYDSFSNTGKHSAEWVQITKEFLKLAFAGGHHEVSCP
jgi:hypothetical protein